MSIKHHRVRYALLLMIGPLLHAWFLYPNTRSSAALAALVTIRRDAYGIPHILAETEEAAAFGFGYAQAEDHCLEVARSFISARGEEAKIFGTGIENDFLLKLYENQSMAAQDLRKIGALYRTVVNAYASGFNWYVEKHRGELPDWIPLITGVDVMASRRAGAIRSAFSQATLRALQRKYPASGAKGLPSEWQAVGAGDSPAVDAAEELPGSNAFALSGSRTTSGFPILLGNPHLDWSSLYWEAQVTVPGKIDFFGSTLAGIPVLRAGFNQHLGWVTTNNYPDVSDVFTLSLDPKTPDHYLFEGKPRPLLKKEVSIEVKTSDGTVRTEKRTYGDSHLGKILYRTADRAFAVKSAQIDAIHYYEGFYLLSRTRNLKEFLDVMKRNYVPTSNFTYADADGNIM